MYVPILPEQPIPATTNVLSGSLPVFASAFIIPFIVPKSPQPGHQVGCLSDLKSVNLTSELMLLSSLPHDLDSRIRRRIVSHSRSPVAQVITCHHFDCLGVLGSTRSIPASASSIFTAGGSVSSVSSTCGATD